MPQHQVHAPAMRDIETLSPLDLHRHGIADLLARQQEEHEEYLVERAPHETPGYLIRLRAAQQAAQNAASSTRDGPGPQYPYWFRMGIVVALTVSILIFLKMRLS
jgi:hypothetical protein